jgi:hypothetical protein
MQQTPQRFEKTTMEVRRECALPAYQRWLRFSSSIEVIDTPNIPLGRVHLSVITLYRLDIRLDASMLDDLLCSRLNRVIMLKTVSR